MKLTPTLNNIRSKLTHEAFLVRKRLTQNLSRSRSVRDRSYVFIAGMQRSGTNMLMDILERSPDTDVYHESDARAFDNYEMRPRPTIWHLAEKSPAKRFVIKALCELQELKSLLDEFSPGRAIWIFRNYEDVVNSMLISFRNHALQVRRIAEDRDGSGWLGHGMSHRTHDLVRSLVHPEITDASAAALQWYFRNILFFEQRLDSDTRVLSVRYEDLVQNPEHGISMIYDFARLPPPPHVAAEVFSTSIKRRTAPQIEPAVKTHCDELTARINASLFKQ